MTAEREPHPSGRPVRSQKVGVVSRYNPFSEDHLNPRLRAKTVSTYAVGSQMLERNGDDDGVIGFVRLR